MMKLVMTMMVMSKAMMIRELYARISSNNAHFDDFSIRFWSRGRFDTIEC